MSSESDDLERGTEGGCLITVKADKFVRALALAIDGAEDCWFSNNYFDLLPDEPTKCFVRTSLNPDEVKQRLTLHCLNSTYLIFAARYQ